MNNILSITSKPYVKPPGGKFLVLCHACPAVHCDLVREVRTICAAIPGLRPSENNVCNLTGLLASGGVARWLRVHANKGPASSLQISKLRAYICIPYILTPLLVIPIARSGRHIAVANGHYSQSCYFPDYVNIYWTKAWGLHE